MVATHGVRTLFTAPTAIRAIKKEDPSGNFAKKWDLSGLRHLFLAGERLDPDTYHWASGLLGIPVIDHWWQTETGWPVAANCAGIERLPIKPGSPTKPVPGWDVHVLDADGNDCPPGVDGAVTVKLPLPPGALPTLYRDDARFARSYLERYPGHYLSGDGGHLDADGYLYVMGRIDDVINVAGHRLSTGSMEEIIAAHPDVAECAVIGVADELKGQLPMGFVVLKAGAEPDPADVERELAALVRERVGPVAAFRRALVVARLPKTRSGKILRATMRDIADGRPYTTPSTIEDPAALPEIAQALKGI
ncbi:AMP-binding enzyme [Nonomuraea diastatica]|uniref:AMP-binding enzyme n=1 Tax=Nonomuraea diastatica TaxID=1848329 RepID=UPI002482A755|nr:AMP-binding protein [Nonomuraea diastatica]